MYRSKKHRKNRTPRLAKDCEFIAMELSRYPDIVRSAEYHSHNEPGPEYISIRIKALIYERIVSVLVGEKPTVVYEYYLCGREPGEELSVYRHGQWENEIPALVEQAKQHQIAVTKATAEQQAKQARIAERKARLNMAPYN